MGLHSKKMSSEASYWALLLFSSESVQLLHHILLCATAMSVAGPISLAGSTAVVLAGPMLVHLLPPSSFGDHPSLQRIAHLPILSLANAYHPLLSELLLRGRVLEYPPGRC
jgi:hypothetical protein